MISSEGYPTYCAGGKCIYPSRNAIRRMELPVNNEYDENYREVYGDQSSQFERFRDLGIPIFVLQFKSKHCSDSTNQINSEEAPVISDEMFNRLFDMIGNTQEKKYTSRNSRRRRKNAKKQTKKEKESSPRKK